MNNAVYKKILKDQQTHFGFTDVILLHSALHSCGHHQGGENKNINIICILVLTTLSGRNMSVTTMQ